MIKACLFDLDGVIIDTATRHGEQWRNTTAGIGEDINRPGDIGLSGMNYRDTMETYRSDSGGITGISPTDRRRLMNTRLYAYMDYLRTKAPNEVICGSINFIDDLRENGIKTGLCTASRNAKVIVRRLGIDEFFDVVLEGHNFNHPDQLNTEVFLRAAEKLGVRPDECVAFEDTEAGIASAKRAGMHTVGVGQGEFLGAADYVIRNFDGMDYRKLLELFSDDSDDVLRVKYTREVIILSE